ncbi:MAG: cell wall-binding repeat-containing protein, partial [Microcella sp.]|nr:cell wall-binding repeat-containing protein [Microcella sp.]
ETQLERLGGASRYDTALAVIKDAFRSDDDVAEDVDAVFLASGANYPDALAAGPAAAWRGGPVIMLDPRKPVLPDEVRAFIAELSPNEIYITGSTRALPASIDADIEGLAEFTDRLSGSSRFETSLLINQAAFQFETEEAVVATGLGFADALSGGPFAAQMGAPLYLAQRACIDLAALQDMSDLNVQRIRFLGSSRALSDDVYNFMVC